MGLNHVATGGGEDIKGQALGLDGDLFKPFLISVIFSIALVPVTLYAKLAETWPIWLMIVFWASPAVGTYVFLKVFFHNRPPRYLKDWWENLVLGPDFFYNPSVRRSAPVVKSALASFYRLIRMKKRAEAIVGEGAGIHPFIIASKLSKLSVFVFGFLLLSSCAPESTIMRHHDDGLVHDPIIVEPLYAEVRFTAGSAALDWRALQDLDHACAVIRRYPNPEIRVVGHADDYLDAHKCIALSKDRAVVILDYLRKQTRAIIVSYDGVGDREPKFERRGDPSNRRVEISIRNR